MFRRLFFVKNMPKITDDELLTRVDQELRQAQDYMGGKLAVQRRKALQYYMAQPEGDLAPPDVDGRSSVVSTDVSDTVEWLLPSLLKIFTASDRVVSLTPRKPGMEQAAEDATDYLNWIFSTQNDGFRCLYTMFKDALISKTGILKVWWEDKADEAREEYEGLSDQELAQLLDDKEIEPIEHSTRPDEDDAEQRQKALQQLDQQAQQAIAAAQQGNPQAQQAAQQLQQQMAQITQQPPAMLHDVTVKRVRKAAQVKIEPVPPEEFFISRSAKTINDAPFVAHVREWLVSDLRANGYKIEDDELPADDAGMVGRSMERAQRFSYDDSTSPYPNMSEPPSDPSMRRVWVVEAYLRADVDGDGIAEWRRLLKCGQTILDNVECDGPPFVAVTPIPMPHRFVGLSVADMAMTAQRQKTSMIRAVMDNLHLQVNGRYFAVEGQVNLDDLLTSRPGGVVRVKQPGAVGSLQQGMGSLGDMYQMLEYTETQKENRTGFTRQSAGADANAINKTATGVSIITNRADMRTELIARVFAETGVKDLFLQMLKLVCKYQQQEAEIHLNGRWLKINPREWRHQFDVIVNVGLGTNDTNQKQVQIGNLLAMQEKLAGIGLVGPREAFNGGAEMVKTLGYKDVTRFLKQPPDQPPPPQPPLPLQIEQMKLQAAGQHKQADAQASMQLEQVKGQALIQIEQAKLQMQGQIEQAKMQAQMQVDVNRQRAEAEQLQLKVEQDAQLEQIRAQLDNERKAAELQHAMAVEQMKIQAAKEKSELEASVKILIAQMSAQQAATAPEANA